MLQLPAIARGGFTVSVTVSVLSLSQLLKIVATARVLLQSAVVTSALGLLATDYR